MVRPTVRRLTKLRSLTSNFGYTDYTAYSQFRRQNQYTIPSGRPMHIANIA